jgi:cellulose synthase/poly-beta-1,6-N-acetylglucosamine synthase-like glycosyltransferase
LLKYVIASIQSYFIFYTYLVFLATAGAVIFRLRYKKCCAKPKEHTRFALMLPAYKANQQFLHVVDACLAQNYPRNSFEIFVLAQHCSSEIVMQVQQKGLVVFEKSFDNCPGNPYLYALNYFICAIEEYAGDQPYDAIVLIDKDNLLDEDFLSVINCRFQQGHVAVQGRRRPFNLETKAACFDYISETMNDQMLRAAKTAFGLSAEISGSGMAFDFNLYKRAMSRVDFQSPVHDKTFFLELIKLKTHVFYEPRAVLYEEKTESYEAITQQRTRWIGGQFYLWRKNFLKLVGMGLKELRLDPIDYAITLFKMPRSLNLTGLVFWLVFALLFPAFSLISSWHWGLYLTGYLFCILLLLIIDGAPRAVFRAFLASPLFILSLLKSTWKSITVNVQGSFIHTKHSKVISLEESKKKGL